MKHFKHLITALVVLGLLILGANVFARMGTGSKYGHGMSGLTGDEMNRFHEENASFMKERDGLRQSLYQKNLELRAELSKTNVDAAKVSNIQKEISSIEAGLDQKRLDHRLKWNKVKSVSCDRGAANNHMRYNHARYMTE